MKTQFIPLEKRSKREQKEYHAAKRGSWGAVNPVTRKPPNPKAYKRKSVQWKNEPPARIIFLPGDSTGLFAYITWFYFLFCRRY